MACRRGRSEEREDCFPSQNGFATLPLSSVVSQSYLNAARFIIHLHTTAGISFLSRITVQMPTPNSQGQIALSGERLSVADSPVKRAVTASHGSHWGHRSGGKKESTKPSSYRAKILLKWAERAFKSLCATVPSDGLTQKGKQGDKVSAGLASYPQS